MEIHEKTPFFHVDACQAAGALNLNVNQLGVDLMTLNSSKIYGPKGVGCLYVRRGVELVPLLVGGQQERGLRAGTENVAGIAGFALALELADGGRQKESTRLIKLRDYLIKNVLTEVPDSRLNGDPVSRLPNNVSVTFDGVDGEMLVLALDQRGIQTSAGAACTATETGPSHVLSALNPRSDLKNPQGPTLYAENVCQFEGNLRLTLGRQTTKKDIDYVLKVLPPLVKKLRNQV